MGTRGAEQLEEQVTAAVIGDIAMSLMTMRDYAGLQVSPRANLDADEIFVLDEDGKEYELLVQVTLTPVATDALSRAD